MADAVRGAEGLVEDLGLVAVDLGEQGLGPGPEQQAVHHLGRGGAAGVDGGVEDAEEGRGPVGALVGRFVEFADVAEEARQDAVGAGALEEGPGAART